MEHGGRALVVLSPIQTVPVTGSTNADLLAAARGGAPEGTWLRAERQEAGRGRQARTWASPAGNLYASTIVRLRPTDPPAASLALVAAVALMEAMLTVADGALAAGPRGPSIKWPNDLLVGARKLSGILLERADDAVVIGFGVNVAHHPDIPDRPATSLAREGVAVTPAALLEALAPSLAGWVARWRGEGLVPVIAEWSALAHAPGSAMVARLPDGTVLEGFFEGLDATGALLLGLASGERRVIHAADLFTL